MDVYRLVLMPNGLNAAMSMWHVDMRFVASCFGFRLDAVSKVSTMVFLWEPDDRLRGLDTCALSCTDCSRGPWERLSSIGEV